MADNFTSSLPGGGGTDFHSKWTEVTFGGHVVLMARETLELYNPKSLTLTLECKESGAKSSHPLQDNFKTTISTIQDLPDEMLSRVFMFLKTEVLLLTCRLVSKRWKAVSSEICRKRFVKFNYSRRTRKEWLDVEYPANIFMLFDMESLPWSSCSYTTAYDSSNVTMDRFIEVFGEHIWSISLYPAEMKRVLRHTPNIRQLEVNFRWREWGDPNPCDVLWEQELDFDKLKRLELGYLNAFNMKLLQFVVERCGARLEYLKSNVPLDHVEDYAETFARLLRNVPFISLKLDHPPSLSDNFKVFVSKTEKLRIRELVVSFVEFGIQSRVIDYEPEERFLTLHSHHLEKLDMNMLVYGLGSMPFQFPVLPSLTFLSIEYRHYWTHPRTAGRDFLSLLQPNQFPVLDEVHVIDLYRHYYDTHHYFPDRCRFDSVTKLTLQCYYRTPHGPVRCNWSRVFPNVTFLNVRSVRPCEFHSELGDFFSFRRLEVLTVQISHYEETTDLNRLFGIPKPGEIPPEFQIHVPPSILQLTSLKSLKIDFHPHPYCYEDDVLEIPLDADASLPLLRLQPLNLTLSRVTLPDEAREILTAHHRNLTILGGQYQ